MKDPHDPGTEELFDWEPPTATSARDEALERVLDHEPEEWKAEAAMRLDALPCGWEGTGEDIRLELTAAGLPPPHHHNVWGGFINGQVRAGLLEWTGAIRNMRTLVSHARCTKVYRRTAL